MRSPLICAATFLLIGTGTAFGQIDYLGIHLEQQRWNNLLRHQQQMTQGSGVSQTELDEAVSNEPADWAPKVMDEDFLVIIQRPGEDNLIERTSIVPMIPEDACWLWAIQLDDAPKTVEITETLTLPADAEIWETRDDARSEISEDRSQSVSTVTLTTEEGGWISRAWCIAEGDPLGQYHTEIAFDGQLIGTFTHEVRARD